MPGIPNTLKLGVATTDEVQVSPAATVNNLDPFTYIVWFRQTAIGSIQRFVSKGASADAPGGLKMFRMESTNNISLQVNRSITNTVYASNNTPLAVAGPWYFAVATFNGSNNPPIHLYVGSLQSPPAEVTYGTTTIGAGAVQTESATDKLQLFNGGGAGGGLQPLKGSGAFVGIWAKDLTVPEILTQYEQLNPAQSRLFMFPGQNTGRAIDWSGNGNHGVIVGAVPTGDYLPRVGRRRAA